jgi:catechol 2,3-dioxygenase-like lactoylglutathione lyase family enzyme
MDATVAFYRWLGLEIEDGYRPEHVAVPVANGLTIEFDATDFVPMWDAGWRGGTGGSTVLSFECRTREAVDELFEDLTAAGYAAHQRPYDAFWGTRYAIVEDPDGNGVGLMSPIDPGRKSWPPRRPATA